MRALKEKTKNRSRDTLAVSALLTYAVFPTELGWMGCIWKGNRLDAICFGQRSREAARTACASLTGADPTLQVADFGDPKVASLVQRLTQYAAGADDNFLDITLNQKSNTPFQQRVVALTRRIRAGTVLSYGELAAKAGAPGAARAVGTVMRRNRFPLIVPCHRVIASGGAIGGYSAPEGIALKRKLLGREGVTVGKS